jgi:hypothetical protein
LAAGEQPDWLPGFGIIGSCCVSVGSMRSFRSLNTTGNLPCRALIRVAAAVCLLPLLLPASATRAGAQSFFETLFGGWTVTGRPSSRPAATAPRERTPWEIPSRASRWQRGSDDEEREGNGGYTTMCVRLCDGFYFPVSHRVRRARFYRDAEVCRSRCGGTEAVLFYRSSSDGDMSQAVDLTGRAYTSLSTAFLHRKQRVAGCTCKAEPWTTSELARHYAYRIADEAGPSEVAETEAHQEANGTGSSGDEAVDPHAQTHPATAWSAAAPQAPAGAQPAQDQQTGPVMVADDRAPIASPSIDEPVKFEASPVSRATVAFTPRRRPRASSAVSSGGASWFSSAGSSRFAWPGDRSAR